MKTSNAKSTDKNQSKQPNENAPWRLEVLEMQPMAMSVEVIPLFNNRVLDRGVPHSPLHD